MSSSAESAFLANIVEPIDPSAPCGADLREETGVDSVYSAIRDARSVARQEERASDDDPERATGLPVEWRTVENLAREALAARTRDLELASWLTEALTRGHGLSGLALGASVISALVETFWDQGLYPSLEADDPEARSFAVSGLSGQDRDGSLIQPIRKTVLFEMGDGRPIAFWEFERASARAASIAQGEQVARINDGLPSLDEMEAVARGPGQQHIASVFQAARQARDAWYEMEACFARACQGSTPAAETPSTSRVSRLLENICKTAQRYVPEPVIPEPDDEPSIDGSPGAHDSSAPVDGAGGHGGGRPMKAQPTRGELLDAVMEIAARFRSIEPHSPFSYTLENAVRRARLTLPDLLREVVADEASRIEILIRLGIQEPEP
ncbi:type VI secretion system protein TssA [Brytella acorum]|uniref:Type VI secretion system protein TssA n=1 Tax=Brytella acorum TaxID=2959299 RepID=A0AA35Y4X3_9PROT|nr:type VI secretion system protein TssA [Brytella acorum]CAI9121515.1 type VI secretion system protein TssA [Brytella acorum]